jgi:hypothetical protein
MEGNSPASSGSSSPSKNLHDDGDLPEISACIDPKLLNKTSAPVIDDQTDHQQLSDEPGLPSFLSANKHLVNSKESRVETTRASKNDAPAQRVRYFAQTVGRATEINRPRRASQLFRPLSERIDGPTINRHG